MIDFYNRIERKIFNSKIVIISVLFDTFCISEIWCANLILTETFFKFFVMLLVLFSLEALEKNKLIYYMFEVIFWGLATLSSPTIDLYHIVILIMWLIRK
ncbi:glycosyltransferase family 39 protein [Clostridium oryzae]|uniref:glycosyltransferase family 39 protein n=1 Tax=Clostridium oryzae TaxID=1450648 RepID=UPI0009A53BFD